MRAAADMNERSKSGCQNRIGNDRLWVGVIALNAKNGLEPMLAPRQS